MKYIWISILLLGTLAQKSQAINIADKLKNVCNSMPCHVSPGSLIFLLEQIREISDSELREKFLKGLCRCMRIKQAGYKKIIEEKQSYNKSEYLVQSYAAEEERAQQDFDTFLMNGPEKDNFFSSWFSSTSSYKNHTFNTIASILENINKTLPEIIEPGMLTSLFEQVSDIKEQEFIDSLLTGIIKCMRVKHYMLEKKIRQHEIILFNKEEVLKSLELQIEEAQRDFDDYLAVLRTKDKKK